MEQHSLKSTPRSAVQKISYEQRTTALQSKVLLASAVREKPYGVRVLGPFLGQTALTALFSIINSDWRIRRYLESKKSPKIS